LHWRPNGNSLILARPDDTPSNERQRERRKQKKKMRQQRKAALKKGGKGGKGGRGGGGSGVNLQCNRLWMKDASTSSGSKVEIEFSKVSFPLRVWWLLYVYLPLLLGAKTFENSSRIKNI
jgi:hypothetical protein